MNTNNKESFWDFSVRIYRNDGVPDACLSLQNNNGVDVNQLLFCCWYAAYFGEFTDVIYKQSMQFSEQWASHVVIPLRQARTWMKTLGCPELQVDTQACIELRDNIKNIELKAEHLQENTLEALSGTLPESCPELTDQIRSTSKNIRRYFQQLDIAIEGDPAIHLIKIISVAFPKATKSEITVLLHG